MKMVRHDPAMSDSEGLSRYFHTRFMIKCMALLLLSLLVGYLGAKKLAVGNVPAIIISLVIFCEGVFALVKLQNCPREMGLTFVMKFLSVTGYKVLNTTLVLWLTMDLGFDKTNALWMISIWSVFMSVVTLLAGSITDALGLRRTLIIGASVCVLMRTVMIFSFSNKWLALGCGLFPLAIGEALCTPVLVAALRKYSAPSQRTVAFSLFYAVMNFGFMCAYFMYDGVKTALSSGSAYSLFSHDLSMYQVLLFVSLLLEILIIPVAFLMRGNVEMTEQGINLVNVPQSKKIGVYEAVKSSGAEVVKTFSSLIHTSGFYKLLVFLAMIGFLKVVFNVMDYVLPPFANIELGKNAPIGKINAINGILILMLAPAIGIFTRKYSAYSMVVFGGVITALSFVFVSIPRENFQNLADGSFGRILGNGYLGIVGAVHPYFIMLILWQVMFSVGEAFYSPRVYEYAASIAPKGQEASYASLSYIPLLIGKLITGAAFGGLLEKYCPETGERNPEMMWLCIGLMVLVAPIGLLVFKNYIRVKEEGRD